LTIAHKFGNFRSDIHFTEAINRGVNGVRDFQLRTAGSSAVMCR